MDIIEIDGHALAMLLAELKRPGIHTLRVSVDEGGAKFKVNNGTWSPALGQPFSY